MASPSLCIPSVSVSIPTLSRTSSASLTDGKQPPPMSPSLAFYECSLSSADIDLSLRDDLTASVQDYLMRIVDELQQLSQWTSAFHRKVTHDEQQQTRQREHQRHQQALDQQQQQQQQQNPPASVSMQHATILMQTETELLRRDIQLASQDVFQRCTTQIAYVQNSFRSEYADQLADLQRRCDDKIRVVAHQVAGQFERLRVDAEHRAATVDNTLRQLRQQLDREQPRLAKLEQVVRDALPSITSTQSKHHQEWSHTQRRVDALDKSLALMANDARAATAESLQTLQDTQAQLSSKLRVVRLEMHEQSDEMHRKFGQLHRCVSRYSSGSGGSGGGGGATATAAANTMNVGSPKIFSHGSPPPLVGGGASSPVKKHFDGTGGGSDCFVHAKAALPIHLPAPVVNHHEAAVVAASATAPPPALSGHVITAASVKKNASAVGGGCTGEMESVLTIHASTLRRPLGREDEPSCSSSGAFSLSSTPSSSPRKASHRSPSPAPAASTSGVNTAVSSNGAAHRPHAPRPESATR